MSKYCTCKVCKKSLAKPKKGTANQDAEIVSGKLLQLGPNDTLVHWSARSYTTLLSTEIASIELRGVNPQAVCASFYLYRDGPGPKTPPKQLSIMGLAGNIKYVMKKDVADKASIYLKSAVGGHSGAETEVVVVLGCGGYIDITSGKASGITRCEVGFTRKI
jgi:hypothetical protein